jgi:phage-related tail protein
MSKVQTNGASIRKLELTVAQIEKQGKACLAAYERWGTEPLARELKELRAAYRRYDAELRTAKQAAK